jgi:predicted RNase H-like nuclease (RuvC/YqgF family)
MRTTQGLRGHKTFIHGLYANHDKPAAELTFRQRIDENRSLVKSEKNSISEYKDRLSKLKSEVVSNTELLTELRRTVSELQNQLALMATRGETHRIATIVEMLGKRLEEHDRWFNPHDIDEIILRLLGGPIAALEKRLDNLQLVVKPGRRG